MGLKDVKFGSFDEFNVVIEIPKGSSNKYEYDEAADAIRLDFVFTNGFNFPVDYGFIPETRSEDGDPLDVMVLSSYPLVPGVVVPCKAIGMIELLDRGEGDNKIIAVPVADPLAKDYNSIEDLSEEQILGFEDFYRELAIQKNKIVEIKGFHGKDRAMEELKKCKR